MKLEDLKKIAAWKTLDEVKEEIIEWIDEVDATKEKTAKLTKKKSKSKSSWEWIKTDWWWKWEWEKDKDWRPIIRKETETATMYRIDRPEWSWEEWDWKDSKQYNVWCVKFKKSWKEYYWYKKDWKFNQVRFVKKPFDLANRLYITGHAYQQKWQGDGDK